MPEYQLHPITSDYADFTAAESLAAKESLRNVGLVVPIVIWREQIVDGRHRNMFCLELGVERRYDDITERCPTEEEMRAYVRVLNQHRRAKTAPLTNAEKRARIAAAIAAKPTATDRAIAAEVGVSHTTVADVRAESRNGQLGHNKSNNETNDLPDRLEPAEPPDRPEPVEAAEPADDEPAGPPEVPDEPIRAELVGSNEARTGELVARGKRPERELCRMLLAAGRDPATPIEFYRGTTLCLKGRPIGELGTPAAAKTKTGKTGKTGKTSERKEASGKTARGHKPGEPAPAKSHAPSNDAGLLEFGTLIARLLQKLKKQKPERYRLTSIGEQDLIMLGQFFARLAALKSKHNGSEARESA